MRRYTGHDMIACPRLFAGRTHARALLPPQGRPLCSSFTEWCGLGDRTAVIPPPQKNPTTHHEHPTTFRTHHTPNVVHALLCGCNIRSPHTGQPKHILCHRGRGYRVRSRAARRGPWTHGCRATVGTVPRYPHTPRPMQHVARTPHTMDDKPHPVSGARTPLGPQHMLSAHWAAHGRAILMPCGCPPITTTASTNHATPPRVWYHPH